MEFRQSGSSDVLEDISQKAKEKNCSHKNLNHYGKET